MNRGYGVWEEKAIRAALRLLWLALALAAAIPASAQDQPISQTFQQVNGSVVLIRAKGRDLAMQSGASVLVKYKEIGSGVLLSTDGKVLTAAHVVQIADEITVEFLDGNSVPARVIASEVKADLALLQLARVPAGVKPVVLGDSSKVLVGEQVFIIGAPHGISHSLSVGYISARHKPYSIYAEMPLAEFFQTDASINTGNSGGPMFNLRGEVIGIVSHIISKSGGFEGVGFVVTSNMARELMLEKRRVWSGANWFRVSGPLAEYLNLPQAFGLLIEEVAKGSPAEAVGLRGSTAVARLDGRDVPLGGDVVLTALGIPLTDESSYEKFRVLWTELRPGDEMTFRVLRAGRVIDLTGRMP